MNILTQSRHCNHCGNDGPPNVDEAYAIETVTDARTSVLSVDPHTGTVEVEIALALTCPECDEYIGMIYHTIEGVVIPATAFYVGDGEGF